jgi:hypothetical protein
VNLEEQLWSRGVRFGFLIGCTFAVLVLAGVLLSLQRHPAYATGAFVVAAVALLRVLQGLRPPGPPGG